MPTKLTVVGKPYKGTPVGGVVSVSDSHVKVLVAMGRLAYGTRMLTAEPVAPAPPPVVAVEETPAPARRGPGRPRKVQPVADSLPTPEATPDTPTLEVPGE